ncbi:hypothetical protein TELCIR_18812, partial [Teladorsagia circumcincta]
MNSDRFGISVSEHTLSEQTQLPNPLHAEAPVEVEVPAYRTFCVGACGEDSKRLYSRSLSLERETGVINGKYSDDLLFLRQLILDGQWDNALDFVEPLKSVQDFDFRQFRYTITKYKFFELLCVKLEPGPLHDNDFAVEELVECLKDLEHICPTPEDYRHLCALLTLPKLSDHAEFKNWNPSSARVECFHKLKGEIGFGTGSKDHFCGSACRVTIQTLVAHLLPPTGKDRERQ